VEVVRRSLDAYQRDDLDSWLASIDPAIEWQALAIDRVAEGAESVYRGHEGMRQLWHECACAVLTASPRATLWTT
jgi:ketosteroid isomerase-like protein